MPERTLLLGRVDFREYYIQINNYGLIFTSEDEQQVLSVSKR